MIAKDCELTLVTAEGRHGANNLVLALNGNVIPHQMRLNIETMKDGYDEVNVTFCLSPKREDSEPTPEVTLYFKESPLKTVKGYLKTHPDYPDFLIVTDDKNSSFFRTEDVARIIITGGGV